LKKIENKSLQTTHITGYSPHLGGIIPPWVLHSTSF